MTRVSGRMVKAGFLVWALAGGCGSDASKKVPGGETATIKIGTLHPLTGTSAANGNNRDQAVDLAVTEINAAGGVLGRHLEVLHRDQGTAADKAVMAAMALVQEGAVAIVGPSSSASSLAVLNGVTRPLDMPQLSCCSTSPALGGMDNFFRTVPSDVLQSKVLARKAQQAGFSKVAIIYVEGAYGQGLAEGFMASFGATGASIMYKEEQPSYAAVVEAAIVGSPDAILLIAYPSDGGKILQESLAKRVQVRWMFSDSLHSQSFIDNLSAAKPLVEGAIGTAPAPSNDAADQTRRAPFPAAYKAALSIDPPSSPVTKIASPLFAPALFGMQSLRANPIMEMERKIPDGLRTVSPPALERS